MEFAYFFIFLASCIIGAIIGLGGGVIIRPILDAIGYHNVLNIAFLTSVAVIIMAMVSTGKKIADGVKIDLLTAALTSLGALIGGTLGNLLLEYLVYTFDAENNVQMVQTIATIITLLLAIYYTRRDDLRYEVKAKVLFPVIGIVLGLLAVFLGIGGGPINVPVFMIMFGLSVKIATAYSIVVIFFSHLSRLVTMGFTEGFGYFDLPYLWAIVPAAIIGGVVGAMISRRLTDETVRKMFMVVMSILVLMNVYNGVVWIIV